MSRTNAAVDWEATLVAYLESPSVSIAAMQLGVTHQTLLNRMYRIRKAGVTIPFKNPERSRDGNSKREFPVERLQAIASHYASRT